MGNLHLELCDLDSGIALYQNNSFYRLNYNLFKKLIDFLKSKFSHEFKKNLFNAQHGYIYFTTKKSLDSAIKEFFEINTNY